MKVTNMTSSRGNSVPNQFIIETEYYTLFQSYESAIVKIVSNQIFLDKLYWDYSKTTSKYRNQFLGKTTKEIKENIASGKYLLTNLND